MQPPRTLVDLLEMRAEYDGSDRAYVVLSDRGEEEAVLTFAGLHRAAHGFAERLADAARPGDRALLVFPPGLDFIVALFACQIAAVIPVPMMMPRRQGTRDASAAIMQDCQPAVALTRDGFANREDLLARFDRQGLRWLPLTVSNAADESPSPGRIGPAPDDLAFLQYTSGSTSAPKGVAVTHANVMANLEMIRLSLGNDRRSTYVNWVPLYHDMGLILNALQTLYVGATCVLMAPNAFTQRPLNWLRAIDRYRAEVACGPNFGYDLCVDRYRAEQLEGVDLSCWKVALNGAEPVRADTLRRFEATFAPHGLAAQAIFPAYGMAEATLLISGGRRGGGATLRPVSREALQAGRVLGPSGQDDSQILVGCGRALAGERIAIVDPETRHRRMTNEVGEVWVDGPNVARSYWGSPETSRDALNAVIEGDRDDARWLRTGDLGFLDASGELYITGRIKDLIIIRGNNHYPQDIEQTVQSLHPGLRPNHGAAFSVPGERGEEDLVLVQEVERSERHRIDQEELAGLIREAIAERHELFARHIVLIRPGSLPKTTSGKIQRSLTRRLWLNGGLDLLASRQS